MRFWTGTGLNIGKLSAAVAAVILLTSIPARALVPESSEMETDTVPFYAEAQTADSSEAQERAEDPVP